jgi:hypothetical protein
MSAGLYQIHSVECFAGRTRPNSVMTVGACLIVQRPPSWDGCDRRRQIFRKENTLLFWRTSCSYGRRRHRPCPKHCPQIGKVGTGWHRGRHTIKYAPIVAVAIATVAFDWRPGISLSPREDFPPVCTVSVTLYLFISFCFCHHISAKPQRVRFEPEINLYLTSVWVWIYRFHIIDYLRHHS